MATLEIAQLADRGALRVTGPEAEHFLQGLVTNDLGRLSSQPAIHAALLTPQGKILFDFFVVRHGEGFILETVRAKIADLVKRLMFYRLRSQVIIADASADWAVFAGWGGAPAMPPAVVAYPDPRLAALGLRMLVPTALVEALPGLTGGVVVEADAYHAQRIAAGVPEGGRDFALAEAYPHEADMDLLHGVDFKKGCYVGQEVVSRMEHRSGSRKRIVPVVARQPLPPAGTEIVGGTLPIGTLGTSVGRRGLALVRLDRVEEIAAKSGTLTAAGVPLILEKPGWATFPVPSIPLP